MMRVRRINSVGYVQVKRHMGGNNGVFSFFVFTDLYSWLSFNVVVDTVVDTAVDDKYIPRNWANSTKQVKTLCTIRSIIGGGGGGEDGRIDGDGGQGLSGCVCVVVVRPQIDK